ncbi:MAG: GTP-binding protein [Verrucomicrobiota bacterium]
MESRTRIEGVPTHIITGFLGSGKTTTILHLLKEKPSLSRWAVLVNEFGEIGVDGALFEGRHRKESGVFIREVPGGCMCCTANLPMQVALNALLREARPDRLFIEPTGLGHPVEVLEVLSGENYRESLSIQRVVSLVDARCLADDRYLENETFVQQVEIADILVGNKADLYSKTDHEALKALAEKHGSQNLVTRVTEHGEMSLTEIMGDRPKSVNEGPEDSAHHDHHHHHHDHHHHHEDHSEHGDSLERPIPEEGYVKVENSGEGYQSTGWRFNNQWVFDRRKLRDFFKDLRVDRMKAFVITDTGYFCYNLGADGLNEDHVLSGPESRIEIVAQSCDPLWENSLMACRRLEL